MDMTWTTEQKTLRSDFRAWLAEHEESMPVADHVGDLAAQATAHRHWQRLLADDRWAAVHWPVEYGGRGRGPADRFIVEEELALAGSPELITRIGPHLAAPTLFEHGTPAQRDRWLPPMLSGEELWCQLFSEPNAGSDLSRLRTRAVRTDGGWLLNGQKVWSTFGHLADWAICLARSDPRAPQHHGISYFLVDMRQPGVQARPLGQLTGESEFSEVFLDDVFVPDGQLVGAENNGWQVARATLKYERGGNPRQMVQHIAVLERLLSLAASLPADDQPEFQERVAAAIEAVGIFRIHVLRVLAAISQGQDPNPDPSVVKLFWTEHSQRLYDTAMRMLGRCAPLWGATEGNVEQGSWQRAWLASRAVTIYAGSSEIQRNLISERILGLPREPAGPGRELRSGDDRPPARAARP